MECRGRRTAPRRRETCHKSNRDSVPNNKHRRLCSPSPRPSSVLVATFIISIALKRVFEDAAVADEEAVMSDEVSRRSLVSASRVLNERPRSLAATGCRRSPPGLRSCQDTSWLLSRAHTAGTLHLSVADERRILRY
ncbi:hypothetical protein PUN28_018081 [Cardiocondyla obscurior]|uniref:Uncharacterized protein n=1 Tax=Cardiocondyla obscurior TaxID=286306 RepID=A0AAW2EGQ8_9HYME